MFRIYAVGDMGYAATAAALNKQGWRQKSRVRPEPHPFNLDVVQSILKSWRVYAGEIAIGIRKKRQYVPGAHDPIIPADLCRQVGKVLKQRARTGPPERNYQNIFLLSGRTFCALCGKPLDGHSIPRMKHRGLRHRYGREGCQEPLPYVEIIETSLLNALEEIPRQSKVYDDLIDQIDARRDADDPEQTDRVRLMDLNRKLQRITELYIDGDMDKTTYKSHRAIVEAEIAKVQATTSVRTSADLRLLTNEVIGQLGQLSAGDSRTKKMVIHNLVERLEILQRKIVRLVPTPQAAPFFTNLMSVDVGYNSAFALDHIGAGRANQHQAQYRHRFDKAFHRFASCK